MGSKIILITIQTFTENTITVCADNDDKIQRLFFFFVCSLNLKQSSWERKEGKKRNTQRHDVPGKQDTNEVE